MAPRLYVVIPCYNEESVLPVTAPMFLQKIKSLAAMNFISPDSRILFVNDGSRDKTWDIITDLSLRDSTFTGISLSRNRGHQNALLAGLMEAKGKCDITISIDCDGQDDISAMEEMIAQYRDGCEVVYGVRSTRKSDSFFKRQTANGFYRMMQALGADILPNHADYRLLSNRVLEELSRFEEVNIFLRGMIPIIGFKSTSVYYTRIKRLAGKSHYPLGKMLGLALDGITSLSVTPLRLISALGAIMSVLSLIGVVWAFVAHMSGSAVTGWPSLICVVCMFSGIQLICLGVVGEYIGKIYMEVKHRPRYIVSERTEPAPPDDMRELP